MRDCLCGSSSVLCGRPALWNEIYSSIFIKVTRRPSLQQTSGEVRTQLYGRYAKIRQVTGKLGSLSCSEVLSSGRSQVQKAVQDLLKQNFLCDLLLFQNFCLIMSISKWNHALWLAYHQVQHDERNTLQNIVQFKKIHNIEICILWA